MVHCMKHGGKLATISNFDENEIVKTKINKSGQKPQFWMSGMNLALAETWTWMSTGQPFTFTDWTAGQPDGYLNVAVGEHCMEFWEAVVGLLLQSVNVKGTPVLTPACKSVAQRRNPLTPETCF
ncbi:mannose binding [Homalodisca vitripennis]|nr:mannose binding [Homalodisca vitripennis]